MSSRFLADVASGLWQTVHVVDADYDQARRLVARHGLSRALRTLAVALRLRAGQPVGAFVCADTNLCHVAAAEGFAVLNPEVP